MTIIRKWRLDISLVGEGLKHGFGIGITHNLVALAVIEVDWMFGGPALGEVVFVKTLEERLAEC